MTLILPIKTLIDRVKKMKADHYEQNTYASLDLDGIINELHTISKDVDDWWSQAIVIGFKDEYDHIAEELLGRPFSNSEWQFSVKDSVENDSSILQSTGDAISEYATDLASEIKLESEEE